MATSTEGPKEEYRQASENMRLYANMRFAQLTLFLALTAGLLTIVFAQDPALSRFVREALKAAGLVASIVFAVIEERSSDFFHYYMRRAIELEKVLGYNLYSSRPARRIVTATNAVRLLFILMIVFWAIALAVG